MIQWNRTGACVILSFLISLFFAAFISQQNVVTVYLIGDSTMADYANEYEEGKEYMKTHYPMTGWGQVFQDYMSADSIKNIDFIKSDSVLVDDRARGGRSTRTFFQEGRWRAVYENLKENDIVMIQFGHNDAAATKTERYVDVEGYKEFLRLFVSQTLQKSALPVVLTPVARNYPWKEGRLENVHADYPMAAKAVATEFKVPLIDLNQLSMDAFTKKGQDYVTHHYFMNIPAGKYEAYPNGLEDNTHFQPEGAQTVAQIVLNALREVKIHTNE